MTSTQLPNSEQSSESDGPGPIRNDGLSHQQLVHLLKWQYQPSKQSGSWRESIREHRIRIQEALSDSPSLENHCTDSYRKARQLAADETGLDISTFPTECPYTPEQILESEFLP